MHIATIGVEDWLNVWEKSATYDIARRNTEASFGVFGASGQESSSMPSTESMRAMFAWASIPSSLT